MEIYLPLAGPIIAVICGVLGMITGVLSFLALILPLPFLGFQTRVRAATAWAASVILVVVSWILLIWKTS